MSPALVAVLVCAAFLAGWGVAYCLVRSNGPDIAEWTGEDGL